MRIFESFAKPSSLFFRRKRKNRGARFKVSSCIWEEEHATQCNQREIGDFANEK